MRAASSTKCPPTDSFRYISDCSAGASRWKTSTARYKTMNDITTPIEPMNVATMSRDRMSHFSGSLEYWTLSYAIVSTGRSFSSASRMIISAVMG